MPSALPTSTNGASSVSLAIKRVSIVAGVSALTAGTAVWSYQAAWAVLSVLIVAGVYWWGVGSGSRYEPPPLEHLNTTEGPERKP